MSLHTLPCLCVCKCQCECVSSVNTRVFKNDTIDANVLKEDSGCQGTFICGILR